MIEHIRSINFSKEQPVSPDELQKTFASISHELDSDNLSSITALDQALLSFNALTRYDTSVEYDQRYYSAVDLEKYATGSLLFTKIANRLPDNHLREETYDYAAVLATRTHQILAEGVNSFGGSAFNNPDRVINLKDYTDTFAMSALLFEEQWRHRPSSIDLSDSAVSSPIDTSLVSEICKSRCNFVEALDESKPLAVRSDLLKAIIDNTSELRKELHERSDLPAARGSYKLLSARIWHDRALLGEYGAGALRDEIIHTSVNELWDAADEISRAKNDLPELGEHLQKILEEIEYFRGRYSEEVGLDAAMRPLPVELDITSLLEPDTRQTSIAIGRSATHGTVE